MQTHCQLNSTIHLGMPKSQMKQHVLNNTLLNNYMCYSLTPSMQWFTTLYSLHTLQQKFVLVAAVSP